MQVCPALSPVFHRGVSRERHGSAVSSRLRIGEQRPSPSGDSSPDVLRIRILVRCSGPGRAAAPSTTCKEPMRAASPPAGARPPSARRPEAGISLRSAAARRDAAVRRAPGGRSWLARGRRAGGGRRRQGGGGGGGAGVAGRGGGGGRARRACPRASSHLRPCPAPYLHQCCSCPAQGFYDYSYLPGPVFSTPASTCPARFFLRLPYLPGPVLSTTALLARPINFTCGP